MTEVVPSRPAGLARTGVLDDVQLHVVRSIDDVLACRRWAGERREGPLAFDTESGGLNPHKHRHRMTQLGDLRHGWAFDAHGWGGAATEILRDYTGELVAHNSPYDARVLEIHTGLAPRWERTHDTLLAAHITDSVKTAKLKPRAAIEIDPRAMRGEDAMEAGMRAQGWGWDDVPFDWMPYTLYGALDPVLTAHLWQKFGPEVTGRFAASYQLERATARICAQMMSAGMMIDRPFIGAQISQMMEFFDKAMDYLHRHYGLTSINSAEQIARVLNNAGVPTLVTTPTGQPSIDKDTLKMYATAFPEQAPLIRAIARCRKTDGVVHKYLEKFLALADGDIMHYQIWTSQARTSRMSVTDPPMQTYDRDEPAVRGSYVPRPGHVFISIDADQIEARLAASFSGDQQMTADFLAADAAGQSFFVNMATKIYAEQITKKDQRYTWTKNATYGQIYGAGLEKAAKTAGVPVAQMQPIYAGTARLYPGLNAHMNTLIRQARSGRGRGQVLTHGGRRLYCDRGHEYALMNYQIQGSAAEIMKQGLVNLDTAGFGPYLRLPVHDEILIEAPAEYAREMLKTATRILTDRETFPVALTWSGNILPDRWKKT